MKKLIYTGIILGAIYALVLLQSCEKEYFVPATKPLPDSASFQKDILPIFTANCTSSGCHTTGGIAPDLSPATAYSNLFIYGLVDTANVESSVLYMRMTSASNPMPPTGKLPTGTTDLVKLWIEQGAKDN